MWLILKKQQDLHEEETGKNLMVYIYSASGRTQWAFMCFCSHTVQARGPHPTEGPYIHRSENHELGTLSPRKGLALFSCFLEMDHSLFGWTVSIIYTTLKMHYFPPKYQNVVSISTDISPPVRVRTSGNKQCNQHALKKKNQTLKT